MRSVDVIYLTVMMDDVSVKLPKNVSDFLFSEFLTGRAHVVAHHSTWFG
jgi:hypothetical protein